MSPAPSLFQEILRRLVLRLVVLMGGALGLRVVLLRARLRGLPAGSRHRAALEADIARLERLIDWINDPEVLADWRYRGMIAEAAVCFADAGRRAWIRLRWIWGWATRFRRLRRARLGDGAAGFRAAERSTTDKVTQKTVRAAALSHARRVGGLVTG